ncbi:hypothetical protein SEPCBS57363_000638 [Sporothrix epigloea]|uniref:Fungal lipase-type domain-containing protein n=1 Tax=Sporothrix epigloea TaxID=1892477 RepID=A0ABP0D8B5_9PEZI
MRATSLYAFAVHFASLFAESDEQKHALGVGSNSRGIGWLEAKSIPVPPPYPLDAGAEPGVLRAQVSTSATASPFASSPVVPLPLFLSLERYARLVDIAYCVGIMGSGISRPFSCISRCADFPEIRLLSTWSTGILTRDSCGYIAIDDSAREIIVAFRGTYSIANMVADLSTIPQKYEPYDPGECGGRCDNSHNLSRNNCTNCTVHSGFLDSWKGTRHIVLPAVTEARKQSIKNSPVASASTSDPAVPYRVHLLGHSLGGALAALAALEMKAVLGWNDVVVTTFGEPRVGNGRLATYLESVFGLRDNSTAARYRRVTHKDDPVPLLPLTDWGYSSHAGEVFIKKAELPPTPEDIILCIGRSDPECIAQDDDDDDDVDGDNGKNTKTTLTKRGINSPILRLGELFYAHRDYFWRLGLCVPGSDPADWGRGHYTYTEDEL